MNDRELLDLIPFLENISKVDNVYRILNDATNKGGNSGAVNGTSPSIEQNSSATSTPSNLQKNTPAQQAVVAAAVS